MNEFNNISSEYGFSEEEFCSVSGEFITIGDLPGTGSFLVEESLEASSGRLSSDTLEADILPSGVPKKKKKFSEFSNY